MALGKRIEEVLQRRGWSRADLMEKLPSLTPQALSNLIRRDSKRSEWDEAIADALDVSVMWLVYGQDIAYSKTKIRSLPAKEPEAYPEPITKILTTLKVMSKEGQLIALGRIEELARTYPAAKPNHSSS